MGTTCPPRRASSTCCASWAARSESRSAPARWTGSARAGWYGALWFSPRPRPSRSFHGGRGAPGGFRRRTVARQRLNARYRPIATPTPAPGHAARSQQPPDDMHAGPAPRETQPSGRAAWKSSAPVGRIASRTTKVSAATTLFHHRVQDPERVKLADRPGQQEAHGGEERDALGSPEVAAVHRHRERTRTAAAGYPVLRPVLREPARDQRCTAIRAAEATSSQARCAQRRRRRATEGATLRGGRPARRAGSGDVPRGAGWPKSSRQYPPVDAMIPGSSPTVHVAFAAMGERCARPIRRESEEGAAAGRGVHAASQKAGEEEQGVRPHVAHSRSARAKRKQFRARRGGERRRAVESDGAAPPAREAMYAQRTTIARRSTRSTRPA